MKTSRTMQKGAVSLFVVIFAALLIITIGTAFIRIMIQGQQQASSDDLSRSALDSANAGVEDMKRVIANYNKLGCVDNSSAAGCDDLKKALYSGSLTNSDKWSDGCTATITAGIAPAGTEVRVGGDDGMDQAYTCVKVKMNTEDYKNTLTPGETLMVHLKPGSGQKFDRVTVEWFSPKNLQAATQGSGTVDLTDPSKPLDPTSMLLAPSQQYTTSSSQVVKQWPDNKPSVMRTQLLQYDRQNGFKLSDLDANKTNTDTIFLYPSTVGNAGDAASALTFGAIPSALQQVACNRTFTTTSGGYACKMTLNLPAPINSASLDQRDAYLRLAAPYNSSTDFRVQMWSSTSMSEPVRFSGVQPIVDSTGRADQLFRRIESRIEASGNGMPLINAALDVTGDLCKTFTVGANASQYVQGSCAP